MKSKVLIFFLIGFALYLIDIGFNNDDIKSIYISDEEIKSLISAWESQVGRAPTEDEISRIINNLVEEEILYREALLLGLNEDDRIIKRRLAQKISFLKQESLPNKPKRKDLNAFFKRNKDKYYVEPVYSFTHLFFSSDDNSQSRSQSAFNQVPDNILNVKSDPFFLGKNFADINLKEIENEFGNNFNIHFKESNLNKWSGPYASSFGHHIIFINNYRPGFYPPIDVVIDKVELDLLAEKKDGAISNFIEDVRSEYTVIINPNLRIE